MRKVAPELQRARRQAYMKKYYREHPEKWAGDSARRRLDPEYRLKTRAWNKKWRTAHPEQMRAIHRRGKLMTAYGLSFEAYDVMLAAQDGGCAICGQVVETRGLNVDHDHVTGRVRGLLCAGCNLGIGNLKDDPARLRAAATYLEAK